MAARWTGDDVGNVRTKNGHARRKLRAWLRSLGNPCHICGQPIDYSLPPGNPMSFEVDELIPVSKGGSPIDRGNVAAAHRICNQRRGNKPMSALRSIAACSKAPIRHSREW
ncbi:HNH endonuclease [Paraeggerthella hongkongensis]|uniref:HNH endonuclease n=2 Tax=Paraeggerthella hongkongensis TaxID=230658 RepID=A0A3N0BCP2_9ACTN|nr:HNH endonuclease [Paraeggerthella hongkongensis]